MDGFAQGLASPVTLAWSVLEPTRFELVATWVFSIAMIILIGSMTWLELRRSRQIQQLREVQARANGLADQNAERDQRAYAQHVALNDLAAEKMKLEIQYLQLQARLGQLEVDSRERAEEYHRLMSEKTRFEIQSLKLHIREQNKRLDDYTGFNDDE